MKKIIFNILSVCLLLGFYSCEIDNYDGPEAGFSGKIIDQTTGKNFVMSSKDFSIRMWETSWTGTEVPSPRDINIKDDATFNNDKLFAGTYKVLPYNGPFWPSTDTLVVNLKNGSHTSQDFSVTPYLHVNIVDYRLNGTTLTISGKIEAPIVANLPSITDIRPFIAITRFVGANDISDYSNPAAININKSYNDGVNGTVYTMTVAKLLSGRTFYVRLGARVNDSSRKYNYSEIIEIKVP